MTVVYDDYNGEDIGGQMADDDFLAENDLPREYFNIQAMWNICMIDAETIPQASRRFLSSINATQLFIVAKWLLDNGYGDPRYKKKAGHIIQDAWDGKFNTLPLNQKRCLMGFVRPDLTKLP